MKGVTDKEAEIVRGILRNCVPDCECRAFGSRLGSSYKRYSDLDLALAGSKRLTLTQMADLREAFEESTLPYRVDILDWNTLSPSFQSIIAKNYEVFYP